VLIFDVLFENFYKIKSMIIIEKNCYFIVNIAKLFEETKIFTSKENSGKKNFFVGKIFSSQKKKYFLEDFRKNFFQKSHLKKSKFWKKIY